MKRAILWEYPRESWQHRRLRRIILFFSFFDAAKLVPGPARGGPAPPARWSYWEPGTATACSGSSPELLAGVPEDQRLQKLGAILKRRTGKTQAILRIEPIFDAEQEVKGYMAFAKP